MNTMVDKKTSCAYLLVFLQSPNTLMCLVGNSEIVWYITCERFRIPLAVIYIYIIAGYGWQNPYCCE